MKQLMKINMKPFWYSVFDRKEEIVDEWSNFTGEVKIHYSDPVKAKGVISGARGEAHQDLFGIDVPLSRTLTVAGVNWKIDETSIIWIFNDYRTQPHDHIVLRKAEHHNVTVYALQQVNVSF